MRIVERESRRPDRKRLRLAAFDYSTPGYYFVTLCISGRRCLLGDVADGRVIQSVLGQLVSDVWRRIPQQFSGVVLDEFVIMPNHLHALIQLTEAGLSLSALIGAFKSVSTNTASRAAMLAGGKLWQRGLHDHVVRDEASLQRLREYVSNNPLKWHLDRENPTNIRR